MEFVSIIIPTYNRAKDLLVTLPQVVKYMDENSELIIMDQSDNAEHIENMEPLKEILEGVNVKYYHCKMPSVTLAWNTAAKLATGDILLFLDDDIDIDFDILAAHRAKYQLDPSIIGVAGSYYASSYDKEWVPSSSNGAATTLAGVNVSFLRETFIKAGVVSNFMKPFAPFDWEMAEFLNFNFGKLAVGDDIKVFHRAPASGGCENQSERGMTWYFGNYRNHFLWMFHRRYPYKLTRLPRHFYWLLKYSVPKKTVRRTKHFWRNSLFAGFIDARKAYSSSNGKRATSIFPEDTVHLVYQSGE